MTDDNRNAEIMHRLKAMVSRGDGVDYEQGICLGCQYSPESSHRHRPRLVDGEHYPSCAFGLVIEGATFQKLHVCSFCRRGDNLITGPRQLCRDCKENDKNKRLLDNLLGSKS